jgi:hypothetical protein
MKRYVVFYSGNGCRRGDESMEVESANLDVIIAKAEARAFGRRLLEIYEWGSDRPIYDATKRQPRQAFLPGFIDPFTS